MSLPFTAQYTVNHLTLAALSNIDVDATQNTPILCLHGWLDNAASFIPLAQHAPELPLLAIEFAGHGHSSHRSADAQYYFFEWVADIVALCQQQQWHSLTVIGHSMGGMVATALAASFPELVSRLILIDSLGFITDKPEHAAQQLRQGIESRTKFQPSRIRYYDNLQQAAKARQQQSDFNDAEALLLAQRGTTITTKGVYWRADPRLRQQSVYRLTPPQAKTLMSAISCKVLAIVASDGLYQKSIDEQTPHYKQLTLEKVTGGHHCHMTNAQTVSHLINAFLMA